MPGGGGSGRSRPTIRGWTEPSSSGEQRLPPPEPGDTEYAPPPPDATAAQVQIPPAPPVPATRVPGASNDIDIEWAHEEGSPSLLSGPWRTYEVWTQNNIYGLDGALYCVEVIDRASGQQDPSNKILGSHLMGGKVRGAKGVEISHPLPRVGAQAVFEQAVGKRVNFSETSAVVRVVMRLRILKISADVPQPRDWRRITGSHRLRDE